MRTLLVLAIVAAVLTVGCAKKKAIEELQLLDELLTFQLKVSPNREDPNKLIGKLSVVNSSADMAKYGNFQLFLECDGQRAATEVKAEKANAMADQRLLHLSPGDSLGYFVQWTFENKVDFQKATFALSYDATIMPPAAATEATPEP